MREQILQFGVAVQPAVANTMEREFCYYFIFSSSIRFSKGSLQFIQRKAKEETGRPTTEAVYFFTSSPAFPGEYFPVEGEGLRTDVLQKSPANTFFSAIVSHSIPFVQTNCSLTHRTQPQLNTSPFASNRFRLPPFKRSGGVQPIVPP